MQLETRYLSSQNSVADNLKIMAESNIFVTKDFEAALMNVKSYNFRYKSNVLKIIAISIFIFSILAGYLINKVWGFKISLLCLIPIILHQAVDKERQYRVHLLKEEDKKLASIYNQILENFKTHIYFKENYLIAFCNSRDMVKQDFDFLNLITTNYNYNHANLETKEIDEKFLSMRQEYSELRLLAKKICMKNTPSLIHEKIWNKFRKLCWQLSYGRCFSKHPITFVELYKSDQRTEDSFDLPLFKARAWKST